MLDEAVNIIQEAIGLLESPHLVWSADMETIRPHLSSWLRLEIKYSNPCQQAIDLATELLYVVDNDITVA